MVGGRVFGPGQATHCVVAKKGVMARPGGVGTEGRPPPLDVIRRIEDAVIAGRFGRSAPRIRHDHGPREPPGRVILPPGLAPGRPRRVVDVGLLRSIQGIELIESIRPVRVNRGRHVVVAVVFAYYRPAQGVYIGRLGAVCVVFVSQRVASRRVGGRKPAGFAVAVLDCQVG